MAGAGVRHVLLPGPWRHLDLSANGVRLHVAVGEHHDASLPLVLLLPGFAQHWWAWRHVVPALDEAGYAVAALDPRGCGASDQTPHGYDAATTVADLSGVVRTLGHGSVVLVGHDTGARSAWLADAYAPGLVRGLVTVGAPHPSDRRHALDPLPYARLPFLPERRLSGDGAAWVEAYLRGLTADPDALATPDLAPYREALRAWPAPRCAVAPLRLARGERRAVDARLAAGTRTPLLLVRGSADPVVPAAAIVRAATYGHGRVDTAELPGSGHLVPEEAPAALDAVLLDWLDDLSASPGATDRDG